MRFWNRLATSLAVLAILLSTSLAFVDHAEARRGGSFGSRGTRTFQAPPATQTAPTAAQPVQRSMTQPSATNPAASQAAPAAAAQRGGFLGGFGGSMLRGLAIGGLIGLLLGHGFGGLAGAFGMILQIALLALGAMLLFRLFAGRRQQTPAMASASGPSLREAAGNDAPRPAFDGLGGFGFGGGDARPARPANARNAHDEVGILDSDLDMFQQRLDEVQAAFSREDYAELRRLTTPEIMSYLSEELSQNATSGVRNEVVDVKLLQGDLAEAWREGDTDYATVAMRYESRDVMRDRATGAVVSGDASAPTETTELWTFVRRPGSEWLVSAIQES